MGDALGGVPGGGPATRKGATGVGPLRLWPGGLCLSRAIGDFDVGDSVLCLPYISQVLVPMEGARLLIASDGVWDAFEKTSRVTAIQRSQSTQVILPGHNMRFCLDSPVRFWSRHSI